MYFLLDAFQTRLVCFIFSTKYVPSISDGTRFSCCWYIMAAPIKLFEFVQSSYRAIGIHSTESKQIFSLNPKKLFFLLSILFMVISHIAYFIFESKIADDKGDSFYTTSAALSALIDFSINVYRMPIILQLIQTYNELIEKSKCVSFQCSFPVKLFFIIFFCDRT